MIKAAVMHAADCRCRACNPATPAITRDPILPVWAWALAALVVVLFAGPFLWK